MLTTPQKSLNYLMEVHFPDSTIEQGHLKGTRSLDHNEEAYIIEQIINERKVKRAIHSFGDKKAPGPDGLQPVVIERLPVIS